MASTRALCGLLLLLNYGVGSVTCACDNATGVGAQLDALLATYEREMPAAGARPLRVSLALDLRHATLDDSAASARVLADLRLSWQDSRLTWNASEWGCEWALVAGERLWRPDVSALNAVAADDEPLRARLSSAGLVSWATRLDLTLPVDMDLTDWPQDVQIVVMKFASREFTTEELDFTIKETQYATVFESGSWEIMSLSGELMSVRAEAGGGGSRRVARWRLAVRRRAPAQLAAARVVLAAAVLVLVAAAALPPSARAPVAASAALTVAVWLCGAAWRIPCGSRPARALSAAGGVCGASGAAAACAALVALVARRAGPPPKAVRAAVSAASAFYAFSPPLQAGEGPGASGAWAAAARLLDAALLAALALALAVSLCLYL